MNSFLGHEDRLGKHHSSLDQKPLIVPRNPSKHVSLHEFDSETANMNFGMMGKSPEERAFEQLLEAKQMKDFLKMYAGLVDRCFTDCCNDFTSQKLSSKEVGASKEGTAVSGEDFRIDAVHSGT